MTTATIHHCTNPQRIRADIRQAKNRRRERDPERRKEVRAWCEGKTCTCGCGKPANTPHHPHDGLYDDEFWADLRECEPWYHICHRNYHKGFVRCPQCGGWMKPGSGFETCSKCRGSRRNNTRFRHPCGHNIGAQRCQRNGQCLVCGYSPKKAPGCDHFYWRQKEVGTA